MIVSNTLQQKNTVPKNNILQQKNKMTYLNSRKFRVGHIVKLDSIKQQVWIDYQDNPFKKPLLAKLGNPFQLTDLQKACQSVDYILVAFEQENLEKPIITDIFYSILNTNKKKELLIEGKKIEFKATDSILIECGNTQIKLENSNNSIKMNAKNVTTTAKRRNRVRGGHVFVN